MGIFLTLGLGIKKSRKEFIGKKKKKKSRHVEYSVTLADVLSLWFVEECNLTKDKDWRRLRYEWKTVITPTTALSERIPLSHFPTYFSAVLVYYGKLLVFW